MLPGFSGHLVSETFLEQHLASIPPPPDRVRELQLGLSAARPRLLRLGPSSSVRAMLELGAESFVRALGFGPPSRIALLDDVAIATLGIGREAIVLVVAGWGARLDPLWRTAVVHGAERGAAWSLLFNGTHVRVVGAERVYSRRYAEIDIDVALDDERALAALAGVFHASSFEIAGGRECSPLHRLVDESDRHASAVCRSLRGGVLQASADVLGALVSRGDSPGAFEQALTIVYRVLFLLFAEARGLVPLWHPVYRESYSLEALRTAAGSPGPQPAFWDALRAMSRLAHAGCRAGDLRVTPFNGRLFSPARTPLAERLDLDDEAGGRMLLALATRPAADGAGREPIAYRELGVEQLGAVYETLLDYRPRVTTVETAGTRRRIVVAALEPGSGVRKSTGTFYTPQPLAKYLVRRTLGPLVEGLTPEQILDLKVLDPAMGSGAFLVAACEFLSQAYAAALVHRGSCHPSDLGPNEHAGIRRTIAERCLYGVDLNPMAVQLARLSLWLATMAADRPLGFLDHHLVAGDSLIGAWMTSLRRSPVPVRRTTAAALPLLETAGLEDAVRLALPTRFSLASRPSDTLEHVREKERDLAALHRSDTPLTRWKRVADVWCARWFAAQGMLPASAFSALADAILDGRGALPAAVARRYLDTAEAIAADRRFLHWELEFPEVFFDAGGGRPPSGGFDAVVGNPPWDMIRADAGPAGARPRAREESGRLLRFTRDAGVFAAQSDGHANRYQLFAERSVALSRPGGRIGLLLPSGAASDHGSAPLRRLLFSRCEVDGIVGFDNRDGLFPIHRSTRFLLLTASMGRPTGTFGVRLGERHPGVLDEGDAASPAWFPIRLTPALLERLTGDELALPDLRTPTDLAIAERSAALFPPLGSDRGWRARFGRELNATEDRALFRPPNGGLPVVEGRHIEPFRANLRATHRSVSARDAARLLSSRHRHARLAYRDVAGAANRQTLIAAVLPPGCVSTHTVFCLRTPLRALDQLFLCGLFNSLLVNYLVRLRVSTHVTTAIVERLPVPTRDQAAARFDTVTAAARALARGLDRTAWAQLNAHTARLYQCSAGELRHVLATFPLIARDERDAVLEAFLGMPA